MAKEYSKEQMAEILQAKAKDGKITPEDLAHLVFDGQFPDALFANANEVLTNHRDEVDRFKELGAQLLPYWEENIKLSNENKELKKNADKNRDQIFINNVRIREIENNNRHLESEFDLLSKRIEERKKE